MRLGLGAQIRHRHHLPAVAHVAPLEPLRQHLLDGVGGYPTVVQALAAVLLIARLEGVAIHSLSVADVPEECIGVANALRSALIIETMLAYVYIIIYIIYTFNFGVAPFPES
jgi:hypothetical protein